MRSGYLLFLSSCELWGYGYTLSIGISSLLFYSSLILSLGEEIKIVLHLLIAILSLYSLYCVHS